MNNGRFSKKDAGPMQMRMRMHDANSHNLVATGGRTSEPHVAASLIRRSTEARKHDLN